MDASSSSNSVQPSEKSIESTSTHMLKPTPKVFQSRKSLLEDLYEKGHFPLYPFIPIAIVAFSMASTVIYFFVFDEYKKHLEFILSYAKLEFYNFHISTGLYSVVMFPPMFIAFYGFSFWKFLRTLVKKKSYVDNPVLVLCVIFYSLIFIVPFRCIDVKQMPLLSRALLAILQVHTFMKIHVYIRENIPNVLYYDKTCKDQGESKCWQPNFKKYFYFCCAPTYLYRDSYPRTKNVDWGKFFKYCFGAYCSMVIPIIPIALYITALIFGCQSQYGLLKFVGHAIPLLTWSGYIMFVLAPYGLYHCAFNAWAEIAQFGDRMFHMDWWNAHSYFDLAQKWSFVFHEWLRNYIFLDCRNVLRLSKRNASIMTYLVSAIVHDYVLAVTFGFILPVTCFDVFIYLILLPRTFERKHTATHKAKSNSKVRVFTGFAVFYFSMVFSYYLVVCRKWRCSQTHEASWIDILYF